VCRYHALRKSFQSLFLVDWPIFLLILTALPPAFLPDIGVVLELKGALFGGFVVYFVACLAFVRNRKEIELEYVLPQTYKWLAQFLLFWAAAGTGVSVTVFMLKVTGVIKV